MKIHRFLASFDLNQPTIDITEKNLVHQMHRVLKLQKDESVILGNGKSMEIRGAIVEIDRHHVLIRVFEKYINTNEPTKLVKLYCAILKRENFELIVQKATEIGVSEIIPILSERTIKTSLKYDRLYTIAHEAAELAGRGKIPQIHEAQSLGEALSSATGTKLFFDVTGSPLETLSLSPITYNLFIGPEGGWTEAELALAKENNCELVSLGKLTLRGETAAIVASYLALK